MKEIESCQKKNNNKKGKQLSEIDKIKLVNSVKASFSYFLFAVRFFSINDTLYIYEGKKYFCHILKKNGLLKSD